MKATFDFASKGKHRTLEKHYDRARFALLNHVVEHHAALTVKEAVPIVENAGVHDGAKVVRELIQANMISLEDNKITYLYPVSAVKTQHQVRLVNGRDFFAMCAIDALGCSATFGMPMKIHSYIYNHACLIRQ